MKFLYKNILVLFFLLIGGFSSFSQETIAGIEFIEFNSDVIYGNNSSVSVHIKPTGIYKVTNFLTLGTSDDENNEFILELSDDQGDFDTPIVLSTVYDFYTPLINGELPNNLTAGSSYKLRVRATLGLQADGTYSEILSPETSTFQVTEDTISYYTDILSQSPVNDNYFDCSSTASNDDGEGYSINNNINTIFGSLNRAEGQTTSDSGDGSVRKLYFTPNNSNTYEARLIDITFNTAMPPLDITEPGGGFKLLTIPEGLSVATYGVELTETNPEGISSIYSLSFLWHGDNTNLGNTTTETVCLDQIVTFSITTNQAGIGRNYYGSYYTFNFNDGSDVQYYTHASLMSNNTIEHSYSIASCNNEGSVFPLQKTLYNKYRNVYSLDCDSYIQNGNGANKNINVSESPVASFLLGEVQCETQDIFVENTTMLGEWGTAGICLDSAVFSWYVNNPSSDGDSFDIVDPLFSDYIIDENNNLTIPSAQVIEEGPGCWNFYLVAVNENLCDLTSTAPIQTIAIETEITPNFNILNSSGDEVSEICVGESIYLDDITNYESVECDQSTVSWTIHYANLATDLALSLAVENTDYTYINNTDSNSEEPNITFYTPEYYLITQTILNTCGEFTHSENLLVKGEPTVNLPLESFDDCIYPEELPYLINFGTNVDYKPTYSEAPYEPSTFEWVITGANGDTVTAADYTFVGDTSTSSQFPQIEFNSFLDYNIQITVDGDCDDSGSDSFILRINEKPVITNTTTTETVCSGSPTDGFEFTSSMEGDTSYSWEVIEVSSNVSNYISSDTGNIPSQNITTSNSSSGTITYAVTPSTDFCIGEPMNFTITVNPASDISSSSETLCTGDTFSYTPEDGTNGVVPTGTTYTWTVSGDGVVTGGSSSTSSSSTIGGQQGQQLVNLTSSPATLTYTVTPTSGDNCEGEDFTVTITVNPEPQINNVTQTICNGEFTVLPEDGVNGDVVLTGTTYTWGTPVSTPDVVTGGSAGTDQSSISQTLSNPTSSPATLIYTVTPTSGDNCEGEDFTVTITVNPTPEMDDPDDLEVCNGLDQPIVIDFTTSNSGGVTSYFWENTGVDVGLGATSGTIDDSDSDISFTPSNTGSEPISTVITVTPTFTNDGVSCTTNTSQNFTITVNPQSQINNFTETICEGGLGFSDITPMNGTDGVVLSGTTYSWVIDTNNSSSDITGGSSGNGPTILGSVLQNASNSPQDLTYTVTPTSGDNCEGEDFTVTITVNPSAQVNQPDDITLCNGIDSSIIEFTTLNQGIETSYTWTNNNTSIGLDANGTDSVPIFNPINNTTQPIEAIITVTPLFTGDIADCPGVSQQFIITVNPSAQVIEPADMIVCNQELTTVNFETNNTLGSTSYTWSSSIDIGAGLNGDTNMEFVSSNPAEQPVIATITVTSQFENEGIICDGASETFTISVNGNVNPNPTISSYNGFEISCFGANDGSIELSSIGATPFESEPSYIYQWTGPNGFNSTNQDIFNLEPGIYNLSVTDSLNCVFEFEYEIQEPLPLTINVDLEQDIECNGVLSGEIQITPTGGASPYSYQWMKDGVLISVEEDITGLDPGTYILTLNDSNSCGPVSEIFEITEPTPIESTLDSQVDFLCFGEKTGSLEVTASGGSPTVLSDGTSQYNYAWAGPNGYTSTDEDIFDLFSGVYVLTVSDSYGCEFTFDYELTQPTEDLIINYTTDNLCYESNDGSITLEITGGVEPYNIYWSNFGNGPIQTNLSAGIYEVTVTDFNDCEETVSIEIFEAPLFDIDPEVTQISCFGENDGSINLNIAGGVEPITVTWDDDPTAGDERNNLIPGTYNVLIEDSSGNNCTISQSFIIIESQEIVLNGVVENPLDCDNVNSGSIDLQVVGGTEPYSFLWSNGETTEDLFNIPAGIYSVTVTDFMECEALTQFELYRPSVYIESELEIEFMADCENAIPYQISTLVVSGGVPPYTITWSDGEVSGDNNEIMTTSQNGTVIVDIVDSLGCADQIIFDIDLFEIGEPGFEYTSSGLTECETIGVGDEIFFTNTSTGDYTNLIWSFDDPSFPVEGEENPTHIYNQTGIYEVTLTVEYPYGCTYEYSETIEVTNGYGLVLPNTFTPNGDGLNDTIRPWYNCMNFIEISIYDTFGSLLYVESSTDEIYGWDGTINGKEAENGNYIIVVKAITFAGEEIEINGPVALIR